ncbi:MAG: phosphatase PAP2 family protein [Actinomycetota bacterium]|nr:phosphatase PAP2 family protein [Actinomycetota bacterium]
MSSTRRLAAILVAGIAVALAAWWATGYLISHPFKGEIIRGFDRPVLEYLVERRTGVWNDVMRKVTFFGGSVVATVALAGAAVAGFAATRNPRWPAFFVGSLAGGLELPMLLKEIVGRPRPQLAPLYDVSTNAFPSGHATAAAVIFGAIGFALTRNLPSRALVVTVWVVAILAAAAVGLSRSYLGVHWPTDVVAGWGLGVFWIVIVAAAVRPSRRPEVILRTQ